MAFTFPIALPSSPGFRTVQWNPVSVVGMNTSPFTLAQQVYVWAGQRHEWQFTLPPMKKEYAGEWAAALTSLNGMEGTFLAGPSIRKVPDGTNSVITPGAWPLISQPSQTGTELETSGWASVVAQQLKAGDWLQLGGENYLLYSQGFDNAAWTKNTVTVTANSVAAPDGTTTADTLAPTGSDSSARSTFTPGRVGSMVFSVWLKSASGTVTLSLLALTTINIIASKSISVTTSWQRFELPFNSKGTGAHQVYIGGSSSWATGSVYAWGAQVEKGSVAGGYKPTTSAAYAVTRRLHRVTADVESNGSTVCTIPIWPALRESPTYLDSITLASPKGVFRLSGGISEGFDAGKICDGMSFNAVEVLP